MPVKRIADSTVRRLSAYLRFLEDFESARLDDDLERRAGAPRRHDVGAGAKGPLLLRVLRQARARLLRSRARRPLREILGLGREWRVVIVGAGKIGAALAQYRGFRQRGFSILAALRQQPGEDRTRRSRGSRCATSRDLERDIARDQPDIVVLTVPGEEAQRVRRSRREGGHQGDAELRADAASGAGGRHREDGEHGDGARRA